MDSAFGAVLTKETYIGVVKMREVIGWLLGLRIAGKRALDGGLGA
jgi:hypothetical protein